jgi:hypothetical protein
MQDPDAPLVLGADLLGRELAGRNLRGRTLGEELGEETSILAFLRHFG